MFITHVNIVSSYINLFDSFAYGLQTYLFNLFRFYLYIKLMIYFLSIYYNLKYILKKLHVEL